MTLILLPNDISVPMFRYKMSVASVNGPQSYDQTSGYQVEVPGVTSVMTAIAQCTGGYVCIVDGVDGNKVTVRFYEVPSGITSPSPLVEVASGTDLSSVKVTVIAFGK